MQYITIKEETNPKGEVRYIISAIPLKNKHKTVVQKIPHPTGTDTLIYKTLEQAQEAIERAGFAPINPDGKKVVFNKQSSNKIKDNDKNYEDLILNLVHNKINSSNPNICQASISVLSEFPTEENFNILFEKLGEENELIRKNAISAICKYGNLLSDKIIEALSNDNWVTRNSAINCIKALAEDKNIDIEQYILPLIKTADDSNPIIQANAISVLGTVYQNYKKYNK